MWQTGFFTFKKGAYINECKKKRNCHAGLGILFSFAAASPAYAMHIMEGYLPMGYCIAWGVVCIPFVVLGVKRINRLIKEHRKLLLIFAMAGAYAFVLSALKFPSVTGSSSHPTGTGLGAILFGPTPMAVIGFLVLIFQAAFACTWRLTTLGANTFSMAIAGPVVSWGVYKLGRKIKLNQKVAVFLAAALGNLFTYCVTSVQLGLAHPAADGVWSAVVRFLGIFALTQIPLAVIEGLLTVVILIGLQTYAGPELRELGLGRRIDNEETNVDRRSFGACVILSIVPL